MGSKRGSPRLRHRVYLSSSSSRRRKSHPSSTRSKQASSFAGRTRTSHPKRSHRTGDRRRRPPFPVVILPGAKEVKFLASNSEFKTSELCLHPSTSFSNGNAGGSNPFITGRNVGSVPRSSRCVPPHLCLCPESEISRLQLQGDSVQVSDSPLRPFYVTTGLHQGGRRGRRATSKTRDSPVRLSRRLVDPGSSQESDIVGDKRDDYLTSFTRMVNQPQEVASHTYDGINLSRGEDRLYSRQGFSVGREVSFPSGVYSHSCGNSCQSSASLAKSSWTDGQLSRRRSPLPPAHATNSISPVVPLQASIKGPSGSCPSISFGTAPPSMVVAGTEFGTGDAVPGGSSAIDYHNRCIPARLGSFLRRRNVVRRLDTRGVQAPHQFTRIGSSSKGCQSSVRPSAGQVPYGLFRQHIRGSIHQQAGRDTFSRLVLENVVPSSLVSEEQHCPPGLLT